MLSTILNNTSESNHHDNNDLNFNEEDTFNTKIFDKYEFKYLKWQIKVGNLLNNGSFGFNVDENGKTVITTSASSSSSLSLSLNSTTTPLTTSLNIGRVKSVSGLKIGYPNAIDLIEIFAYVKINYLSNESGDNLLKLLHDFCDRHPTKDDVFLHTKYRSIHDCIGKTVSELYQLYEIRIEYPYCLLGTSHYENEMVTNILRNRGGGSITTSSNNNTRNHIL
jgi:hypothetical protein